MDIIKSVRAVKEVVIIERSVLLEEVLMKAVEYDRETDTVHSTTDLHKDVVGGVPIRMGTGEVFKAIAEAMEVFQDKAMRIQVIKEASRHKNNNQWELCPNTTLSRLGTVRNHTRARGRGRAHVGVAGRDQGQNLEREDPGPGIEEDKEIEVEAPAKTQTTNTASLQSC